MQNALKFPICRKIQKGISGFFLFKLRRGDTPFWPEDIRIYPFLAYTPKVDVNIVRERIQSIKGPPKAHFLFMNDITQDRGSSTVL